MYYTVLLRLFNYLTNTEVLYKKHKSTIIFVLCTYRCLSHDV